MYKQGLDERLCSKEQEAVWKALAFCTTRTGPIWIPTTDFTTRLCWISHCYNCIYLFWFKLVALNWQYDSPQAPHAWCHGTTDRVHRHEVPSLADLQVSSCQLLSSKELQHVKHNPKEYQGSSIPGNNLSRETPQVFLQHKRNTVPKQHLDNTMERRVSTKYDTDTPQGHGKQYVSLSSSVSDPI